MDHKLIKFCILLALLVIPTALFSQETKSASAFLSVPMGAQAIAMGGAYSSVAEDPSIVFYNPGGLVNLKSNSISLSGGTGFDGSIACYFAVAIPSIKLSNMKMGVSFGVTTYSIYDGIDARDDSGNKTGNLPYLNFSPYLTLSFGNNGFGIGVNLNGVVSKVDDVLGYGVSADIGGYYRLMFLTFSLSIKNALSVIKFGNKDSVEIAEPEIRFGLAYKYISDIDNTPILVATFNIEKSLTGDRLDFGLGLKYRLWTKNFPQTADEVIGYMENPPKNLDTSIYALAGYNVKSLSLGFSCLIGAAHLQMDVSTRIPILENEHYGLFINLSYLF